MSKYLCTFPGKFGDILWSLPTAKYIAEKVVMQPVDFAVMPYYESLLPLIQEQSYIYKAYMIGDWLRTHSNYGDQPWEAPANKRIEKIDGSDACFVCDYERVWHLGYRCHPGAPFGNPDMALMDFVAYQQGITFNEPMIPFITAARKQEHPDKFLVSFAFNEQYDQQKKAFFEVFRLDLPQEIDLYDVTKVSWEQAAIVVASSDVFVGDRSANWVIANGLGKTCITFEPHPSRHKTGHLGKVFGCPGGKEFALPFGMPERIAGQTAAAMVKKMAEEKCVATSPT